MVAERGREIRALAEAFRGDCKIGKYGIIDLFDECSRRYKLLRYPLGEKGDMGFALRRDFDIVVFTNSSVRLSREIFTLAHEVGHVVLHLEKENSFVDDSHTVSEKTDKVIEQEANYFAACLLLPKESLNRFFDLELSDVECENLTAFDIAKIMSEFKVSFDMVLNRLEDLEIIDSRQKERLDSEKSKQRVGKLLQATGGDSRLNFPSEEVSLPFEYLNYVIYNYNHGAIPKETLERVLDCYGLSVDDVSEKIVVQKEEILDLDELIGGLED